MRRMMISVVVAAFALATWALVTHAQPAPIPIQPAQPVQPSESPATLRLQLPPGVNLDPHLTPGSNSLGLIGNVYEGLTQWKPGAPAELAPCLAKDWPKISADGLTYTFALRTEAKFHNGACFEENKGRNLKASDVVASFKRLAACSGASYNWFWLVKGWIAGLDEYADDCQVNGGFAGGDDKEVEGLKAPDDATFVLKLKRPCASLLAMLAHPAMSIVAEEALNNYGELLAMREAGTGPYRLHALAQGRIYMFKRVEDYWGEKPGFERITYANPKSILNVISGEWARIEMGVNDYTRYVREGKLIDSLQKAGLELVESEDESINFLCFNMEDPVFGARDADGRGLRKAISLVTNRDQVVANTFRSPAFARVAAEFLPPGCEFSEVTRNAQWGECDPKKAKDALDATKYKGGIDPATKSALKLKFVCDSTSEGMGEVLATALKALGIELEMDVKEDTASLYAALDSGDGQLFAYGWNLDYPIGQNVFQLFDSRNIGSGADNRNVARYNVKEFDEGYAALQKLAMTPDNAAKRKELTKKLSDMLLEDMAVLPLYIRRTPYARNTKIDWPKLPQSAFDEARFIKAKQ